MSTPTLEATHERAAGARKAPPIKRLIVSLAVWYLYVPHLGLLRLAGPCLAARFARLTAWGHWLLTFVGAQKATRRALERMRPQFETTLPIRTMLRKYLEGKHHHFVLYNLATTPRGREFVECTCTVTEGGEQFERLRAETPGVLCIGYHFGSGRMLSICQARRYGADAWEIAHRPETYANDALSVVAQTAAKIVAETDEKCGLRNILISPSSPPISVIKHLRKGHIVGIVGDGMMAGQFIEVPFLGGTMRFATGVARLAAMAKCPIVPVFGLIDGLDAHRVIIHEPITCDDDSPESIEKTMRACAAVLESYVRRSPWSWWIWHRINFGQHSDGRVRMTVDPLTH